VGFLGIALDPEAPTPLYLQLKAALEERIRTGALSPGQALPSERRLAEMLGVSRLTVRRALDELVAGGVLTRRQGSGTYVTPRVEQPLSVLSGFSEDMRARGMVPGSRWVKRERGQASPTEAMTLSLAPGEPVVRLLRVRTADGRPMAVEHAVIPARFLPDPGAVGESLYATLKERGLAPARALERIRAVAATERVAELLGVEVGTPVLYIERVSYLSDGTPLEFTRSHYRGDRYDFVAELRSQ